MTAAPWPDLADTSVFMECDNFENLLNEINNRKYYKGLFEEEGKIESISLLSDEYELDSVRLMESLTYYYYYIICVRLKSCTNKSKGKGWL